MTTGFSGHMWVRGLLAGAALLSTSLPAASQTTLEDMQAKGFVTMGFTNEVPYSYSEDGRLTGADTVVVEAVLNQIGIDEVLGTLTEFQSLIPGLLARRFDMNSTMYIRPTRCEQVLFTEPVWSVGDGVIVLAGNPSGISSYADIAADPSLLVGYLAGATAIVDHMRAEGISEEQMVPFPDPASGFAGVKAQRVVGFANTALANQTLLDRTDDPELERLAPFEQPVVDGEPILGYGAFSFRPEDRDFFEAFNTALVEFRGTPEHLELVRPFGITEEEIAAAMAASTEDLCTE